jgi:hypothetical protein
MDRKVKLRYIRAGAGREKKYLAKFCTKSHYGKKGGVGFKGTVRRDVKGVKSTVDTNN